MLVQCGCHFSSKIVQICLFALMFFDSLLYRLMLLVWWLCCLLTVFRIHLLLICDLVGFYLIYFGFIWSLWPDLFCIMLKSSAMEHRQVEHSAPPATCVLDTQRLLHLLRQPKYAHWGFHRNWHARGVDINSVWSHRCLDRCHLSPCHVWPANFS